jgi:tetratricopeptide (TPR) repeat protein
MRAAAWLVPALALSGCAGLPKVFVPRDGLSAGEHARLGAAYEAQGLKKEASEQYLRALALDRRDTAAWMALGNRYFEDGELRKAGACFARVLKLAPRHPGASNNLAMVYLTQGRRLDEAEALARDALAQGGLFEAYARDTLAQIEKKRTSAAP